MNTLDPNVEAVREESPETPLECADHAERFADEIIADGSNPDAIALADSVKWLCAAVRQLSQNGQVPYQQKQPQQPTTQDREAYDKWAKGQQKPKPPFSFTAGPYEPSPFAKELQRIQDDLTSDLMSKWMQSREKSISDCVRDFLGETRPGEPVMLYEVMKSLGVEGIILTSQATMGDKFQIRKGDQVLREIDLPSVRFGKHNDDQWRKIP